MSFPRRTNPTTTDAAPQDIFPAELESWRTAGAAIIDVREPWEYASGHIPGARNVPLGDLVNAAPDLNGSIVFVCATGNRSGHAAQYMVTLGRDRIANLAGGTAAWARQGRPLE